MPILGLSQPAAPEFLRWLSAPTRMLAPFAEPLRTSVRRDVEKSLGAPKRGPSAARGGKPFLPADAIARRVHGDLPSMLIGGIAALLLQTLHPLVMAGVAEHSRYREDPIGRLRRTAVFIEATTFGSAREGERAITSVRRVHSEVEGLSPDGRWYKASDPDLLTWVHVAEVFSFLSASGRFGSDRLSRCQRNAYLNEMAHVARRLGAEWVPVDEDELKAYLAYIRPQLYAGPQAIDARNFLLRGVGRRPQDRAVYATLAGAAVGVLPRWAREELQIPQVPLVETVVVTPLAATLCHAVRWLAAPAGKTTQ